MRLRASTLPFLPRTTGSSPEDLQERYIGNLRAAETVAETLDRLAAGWVIAITIIGTPAEAETQVVGAS
jgi:hypothetical protein